MRNCKCLTHTSLGWVDAIAHKTPTGIQAAARPIIKETRPTCADQHDHGAEVIASQDAVGARVEGGVGQHHQRQRDLHATEGWVSTRCTQVGGSANAGALPVGICGICMLQTRRAQAHDRVTAVVDGSDGMA